MNNSLDDKIRAVLRETPEGDSLVDEPSLAEELITAFRGRNRWTHGLAILFSFVFMGAGVWSFIRFYQAPDVREQLLWAAAMFFCICYISFQKVWFWMEMHSNRVLREVKRVELLMLRKLK
jgi:hypothetical protein